MESKALIPIGSEITIYTSKIQTDLPQALLSTLPREITASIIDYKITDANGIGYVLMTQSKLKLWIFSNELNVETKEKYGIDDISFDKKMNSNGELISQYIGEFDLTGNYKISFLLNPINLLKWMIYTLKDTF